MNHLNGLQVAHGACNANHRRAYQPDYFIVIIAEDIFVVIVQDVVCHPNSFQNPSTSVKYHWSVLCVKIS
jgi:hypothetical protein